MIKALFLTLLCIFSTQAFAAAEPMVFGPYYFHKLELGRYRKVALGAAVSTNSKPVDSEVSFLQLSPEVFGYRYFTLNSRWMVRPGIRLGYSWMNHNPNLPRSLSISESDLRTTAEVSILWNFSNLLSSLTFGSGMIYRETHLQTSLPILPSNESISGTSFLPFVQGQVAVGITVMRGFLEVAPFGRYTHVFQDSRLNWSFGTEASVSLF